MEKTRNLLLILTIILFLPLFITLISQGQQRSEWPGKIEYEDGVKVIKNPREPLYGEIEFDLEEDLSIGNEEDENCYFYKSIAMEVDSKGNIYVMDRANYRVQKFDKNGNFVLTIGRQGLGPGEFQRMHGLHLDNRERICVLDRRMIHIFNTNGEFEDCINLKNNICQVSARTDEGIEEEIVLLSHEGNKITSFTKSLLPVFKKTYIGHIGGGPYYPRLHFCPWLSGSAIYGHSSGYRIFFIDFSGEVTFITEIAKPPEAITNKERNEFYEDMYESIKEMKSRYPDRESLSMREIKQAYPLPKNKPFFLNLFADEKSNTYVFVMPDLYTKEKYVEFDFFNRQGYYFYRIRMALLPRVIKGGYVYRDRWDEERGFCKIKRYKIKNWDQIKTGM